MKRRDLLLGSAMLAVPAHVSARVCPPNMFAVEGGPTSNLPCLLLEPACALLSPGESIAFLSGVQWAFSEADIAWQSAFYHDDLHGLVHLMGKPANQHGSWKHQIFNAATSRWTTVSSGMWDNPGHIFGGMTMDPSTGDVFQVRGGAHEGSSSDQHRRAGWWQYSTQVWSYTTADIHPPTLPLESHPSGAAYHPDLYGPGDGGLVWANPTRTCFWRKSANVSESVTHPDFGRSPGIGAYWPARNAVVYGGAFGNSLGMVEPNGGGTPRVSALGPPPIPTMGRVLTFGEVFGSLHVNPNNPEQLVIIERSVPYRVFVSGDGANWREAGTHPFTTADPFVVCSLRGGLGAFWAIGRARNRHTSTLWKPPTL